MKNLKRLSLVLALTLSVCSLGSCGDTKKSSSETESSSTEIDYKQPVTSKDKTIVIENDDDEEEETEAPETEAPKTEVPEAEAPQTEALTEAPADSGDTRLTLGEVSGNTYSSKYNGLKITAPDGFRLVNGKDLQELMGAGAAITGMDDTMEMLNQITVNDVSIINDSNGENITIIYENLAKTVADPESFTVEDYLEASKNAAKVTGVGLDAGEASITTLGGQEFYTRSQSVNMAGYTMDEQIFVRKINHYMLVITYSAPLIGEGSSAEVYREWFSALN